MNTGVRGRELHGRFVWKYTLAVTQCCSRQHFNRHYGKYPNILIFVDSSFSKPIKLGQNRGYRTNASLIPATYSEAWMLKTWVLPPTHSIIHQDVNNFAQAWKQITCIYGIVPTELTIKAKLRISLYSTQDKDCEYS
jgi:hypothetical protein